MKKIKLLLAILLLAVILLGLCACHGSFGIDPYNCGTLYLTQYIDENGEKCELSFDMINKTAFFSDDITLQYFDDGTFVFNEFDKEYRGAYTYKKLWKKTTVELDFENGEKGMGVCIKYSGWRNTGTLQVFGREYSFSSWNSYGREELSATFGNCFSGMIKNKTKQASFYWLDNYLSFTNGRVELRGEEYWFTTCDFENDIEMNLSQANALVTYEVSVDFALECGDNVLREGDCILYYEQIKGDTLTDETQYRCAVWYYDTYFGQLFPWVSALRQDDILFLRKEVSTEYWLEKDGIYYVECCSKGELIGNRDVIGKFYKFLKSRYLLKDEQAEETIALAVEDVKMVEFCTFFVTTPTGEYRMEYIDAVGDCFFVVDGEYYRDFIDVHYVYADIMIASPADMAFEEKSATLYLGSLDGEPVKEYENFDVLFKRDDWYVGGEVCENLDREWYLGEKTSEYIVKIGDETLYLIDERHFLWVQEGIWGNQEPQPRVYELMGEFDFSEIFEQYPNVA